MAFSSNWHWFTALVLCLQFMGVGTEPICTEDRLHIQGGHYNLTNGLRTNSKLIYHCPPNYYPYPDSSRLCLPTGRWQPKPTSGQKCRMVECPDPTLEQGDVYPAEEKYYVGKETMYECWSGYELRGSESRVCLPSGKWSGTTPICSQEDPDSTCADPGVPAGAVKVTYDTDEKVTYSCKNKLILVGSRERVCQENGQWTGVEPACYYKHTYDTAQEVSEAFGSSIKESLTKLQPEDTQEGRKIRIPKNGTLNIYIAMDVSASIKKEVFEEAKAAVTKLITKVSSFSVTPNYEIILFSSEIIEIVDISDFFGVNKPTLDHVRERLKNFNVEEGGNDLGTDLDGAFERIREKMAWIKRTERTSFVDHRHVIIVFTDGGFNVGGSPEATVAKIKHMIYHNEAGRLDEEKRKEYLDIYVFAIGTKIFDEDLMPLTAPERSPDPHYFRLKDIKNLAQSFDDIIDEEEVVGFCGLYIEKDKKVEPHKWAVLKYPWRVEVTISTADSGKVCQGSLVSSRFVLTAAHCIKFEYRPEDIKVYTSDQQVREVERFHLHPEFNLKKKVDQGVLEFYDYDVVLLQLKKSSTVVFTSEVRPVCLPCTQATSDALKLVGVSTCKQQEDRLLTKEIERLAFLTAKNGVVQEKDVHAKLSPRYRDECIEQAKHAYGVTTDDVTQAVTKNFICTGGQTPNVDLIACKGDSGGAVFKEYEYRMIQVAVVSWGVHDVCKATGQTMPMSNQTTRDFHINLFRVARFLKDILGNETQYDYSPIKFLTNITTGNN